MPSAACAAAVRTASADAGCPASACSTPLARIGVEPMLANPMRASLMVPPSTFTVAATDEAGNADTSPASYTWTVDTDPPDTTITDNPPARTRDQSAHFEFESDEPGSTSRCQVDSGPIVDCDSGQVDLTDLPEGTRTFKVYARDAAGNDDPTPDEHTWTIDRTAPKPESSLVVPNANS